MKLSIDNRLCELSAVPEAVELVHRVIPGFFDEPKERRTEYFSLRFYLIRQRCSPEILVRLDELFDRAAVEWPDSGKKDPRAAGQIIPVGWKRTGKKTSPNILVFHIDDMGWRDLGCTGSSFYETPVIDSLFGEGMEFANAYAACPVCSPSRACLFTGKYPARLGITDWIDDTGLFQPLKGKLEDAENGTFIPETETTLAETLRSAGYQTWHVGKWHLGGEDHGPLAYGFDVNVGGCSWGFPKKGYFSPYGIPGLKDGPEGEYLTDRLTEEAVALVRGRNREEPFFLHMSHYAVHAPMDAPKKDIAYFEKKAKRLGLDRLEPWVRGERMPVRGKEGQYVLRRIIQSDPVYAAMIWNLDQNIGRLLDCLREQDILDETVIVFISDNGGLSTAEGSPTCNFPAREGKGWIKEGGLRIPLLIRYPDRICPGTRCDVPVMTADIYPTLLELAGLPAMPEQHLDGVSLCPLLEGCAIQERPIFWHYPHYGNQGGTPCAAVRQGRWKLIEFFEDGHRELYDLDADLSEQNDASDRYPELTRELTEKLHSFYAASGAKMPRPCSE